MKSTFAKIYDLTSKIPKGKVATYGEIAKILSVSSRVVGFALHANKNPDKIPCHRVVDRNGKIAQNYAFGGGLKQKEKLEGEKIEFIDRTHVSLKNHIFKFD